jgi:hypothetical protein
MQDGGVVRHRSMLAPATDMLTMASAITLRRLRPGTGP